MFDNQVIHTEHRDVIHDCSYDYYGQVIIAIFKFFVIFLIKVIYFSEWRHVQAIKRLKYGSKMRRVNGLYQQVGKHILDRSGN